jgi:hypothetical protein
MEISNNKLKLKDGTLLNTDKILNISISSANELDENMINQIKLNFINQIQNQLYGNNIIQASEENNIIYCIKPKQKFKKQYLKKSFKINCKNKL